MTTRGKVLFLITALVAALLGACSNSGGDTRTVLIDYQSDDFAGVFRGYYPREITVNPGMTVEFHQTWSGEPHSVTMGTAVQALADPLIPAIDDAAPSEPGLAQVEKFPGIDEKYGEFMGTLPFLFGEEDGVNQAAAQPCYLEEGLPDSEKPCKQIEQPPFDGTHSYYSSGFIPYLGERGNEFEIEVAEDTKPGSYFYYCNLHGPAMSGQITVKNGDIPSQGDVNRQARKETDAVAKPLLAQLEKERSGKGDYQGNLAGSGTEANLPLMGQVNEFTPRTVEAKVGEPVSWTFILGHSISFNVPEYVPWYDVRDDGAVTEEETVYKPAGGWPGRSPEIPPELLGPDAGQTLPAVTITAPDFDGSGGLRSSGTDWQTGDKYVVTFTKKGTYPMACLVHPGMIGKVVVT